MRKKVIEALAAAEQRPKPPIRDLFTDVYAGDTLPPHLEAQWQELQELMAKYPDDFPTIKVHAEK